MTGKMLSSVVTVTETSGPMVTATSGEPERLILLKEPTVRDSVLMLPEPWIALGLQSPTVTSPRQKEG